MWASPPTRRLPIAFSPSVRADVGIRPYEITGGVCVIRTGGQSRPSLHTPTAPALCPYLSFRAQSADWAWESVPPVPASLCEGGGAKRRRERYAAAAPRHTGRCGHRPLRTVYRASALFVCCHSEGAKRPWESVPVSCQQRPKAATYLCRSAAKARFDNRQPPEGVSKEGGPQPSLFGRSRMGDFQGGRKIETSFPLEWRFWLLLSLLTKVTRRRQKKKNIPGGAEPRPYTRLPIAFAPSVRADVGIRPYEITGGVCVIRTGGADPSAPTFRLPPKNPPGPPATPEVLSSVLI